jgi:predicted ATPase
MIPLGRRLRSWFTTVSGLRQIYEVLEVIIKDDVRKTGKVLDPVQLDIVPNIPIQIQSLQRLNDNLVGTHSSWQREKSQEQPVVQQHQKPKVEPTPTKSFFSFSYPNFSESRQQARETVAAATVSSSLASMKGLYLWGGSGCGKTYLSDLFYHNLPIKEKSKAHFHEFMAGIQKDLFRLEKVFLLREIEQKIV